MVATGNQPKANSRLTFHFMPAQKHGSAAGSSRFFAVNRGHTRLYLWQSVRANTLHGMSDQIRTAKSADLPVFVFVCFPLPMHMTAAGFEPDEFKPDQRTSIDQSVNQ